MAFSVVKGVKIINTTVRTKKKHCFRCKKEFLKKQVIVDDDPFGLLCLKCEDYMYGRWMLPKEIDDECVLIEH